MKLFLSALFVLSFAWSADIDVHLYEGTDKESYYLKVQKEIEHAQISGQSSKEIIVEEKRELARLRDAASQVVQIERYDLQKLSEKKVSLSNYFIAVNNLASLRIRLAQRRQMLIDIQAKLSFLKQSTERITEEEKFHLRSYQLQFAYYKIQQKNIETHILMLLDHEQEFIGALSKSLPLIQCNTLETIEKKLAEYDATIERALKQRIAFKIDMEKAVIEDSSKTEQIMKKITLNDALYQKSLSTKIDLEIKQALCMIKEGQNQQFLPQLNELETLVSSIDKENQPLYLEELAILRQTAKDVLGTTKLFLDSTIHDSKEIFQSVKDYVTSSLFIFNERSISLWSLLKAIVLIVFGFILGLFYKRWIEHMASKWPDMSLMAIRITENIGYYLIIITTLVIAVGSLGIDMSSLSLIAGALSIGIGFGLQTVVSNFIAGVILMFEHTIRIGDVIEISQMLRGRVTDIRMRSTTIKTFDNIDIVVPNSSFIKDNVINWTLDDRVRRLHIPFSVAYGTEVEDVKKAIFEELETSSLRYIKTHNSVPNEIWMVSMNSSSVDFELLIWVEWRTRLRPNSLQSDFLILIYNALNKHDIRIPFPQMDLYLKEMPKSQA